MLVLLIALGVDDAGSGMFLPLSVLYLTTAVGVPLATAGVLISVGTAAGLAVPAVAGPLTDRFGARTVVVIAELAQAAGAGCYLVAHGPALALAGAVLIAAGLQGFYSGLFTLVTDIAGPGRKERPIALTGMVRGACFAAGGLITGVFLVGAGAGGYRLAMAVNLASFVACAVLLLTVRPVPRSGKKTARGLRIVFTDRPFLALVAVNTLLVLAGDLFLIGVPVFVLDRLHGPPWLPGALLALLTIQSSTCGLLAMRLVRRMTRTRVMATGAVLEVLWCAACAGALLLPAQVPGWLLIGYLGVATLLGGFGTLISGPPTIALAEALAPPEARGRYLGFFQYSFTVAQIVAPAVVALFALGPWLPWAVVGGLTLAALPALKWVAVRLPRRALVPEIV